MRRDFFLVFPWTSLMLGENMHAWSGWMESNFANSWIFLKKLSPCKSSLDFWPPFFNLPWLHVFGEQKGSVRSFCVPPNSSCKMLTTSEGLKSFWLRGPVFWCGVFFTPLLWWPLFHTFMPPLTESDCWPHINHFTFWFFAGKKPWRSCSACHLPRCFRRMRSQLYRLGA